LKLLGNTPLYVKEITLSFSHYFYLSVNNDVSAKVTKG
jgi:hypothetical protein